MQIRVGCKFIESLFRSLACLPAGLTRFVPCGIGSHLSRLWHLGWLQFGHGRTSRPLESSLPGCLDPVLALLGYPPGSTAMLANGTLNLRYCSIPFCHQAPPWNLGSSSDSRLVIDARLNTSHPLPRGVDDGSVLHRRRLTRKIPRRVIGEWEIWAAAISLELGWARWDHAAWTARNRFQKAPGVVGPASQSSRRGLVHAPPRPAQARALVKDTAKPPPPQPLYHF